MNIDSQKKYRIAIDAMGGDFAPINEINGAVKALKEKGRDLNLEIVLVGNESKIKSVIQQTDYSGDGITIVNADEVVTMHDDPTQILKKKKNSSLYKGIELLANGYVDAFVSAGNTGAVLATATVLLGRINGVSRPTIASFFPSLKNYPVIILDVGANIECKPRFLYEFAIMGTIYANQMLGLENPSVGLLNIGEEKTKGTETLQQTYEMLEQSQLNFLGNIEGKDILHGEADVVVCDGFTGNVVIKLAEGVYTMMKSKFKQYSKKNLFYGALIAIASPVLKKIFKDFDYQKYGGVPILGVKGVVIIGHGKSSPLAVQNMVYKAVEQIRKEVNSRIEMALNPTTLTKHNIQE